MPVTVDTDLPLHDDRSRSWDGDAARSAMARRCATDDGVMAECMGRGFIWRDPEGNAATIGAYSLPVADVFSGDLHLVLSGVQAAANAISPAREPGGPRALDAPESDLSRMRSAVETILARFAEHFDDESIRAPWDQDSEGETASASPSLGGEPGPEAPVRTASGCCGGCGCGTETNNDSQDAPEAPDQKEEAPVPTNVPEHIEAPRLRSRTLRASATGGEWRPPLEHFANPHMAEPTKLTVTADGRVFGHLATWDQPHIGYDGKLVYPPRNASGEYEYFRQSRVVTADGSALAVGLITMATGHAADNLAADAAAAHYDNTGTMVAAVNIGEDQHGIWLAGSLLPDVSPEQRARFSLARVSGDWRQPRPGAGLELIAALSVPNPGFPVRQPAELLAADRMTLAASGSHGHRFAGFPIEPSVVRVEEGQVRTFITAGADVVDQARAAELSEAVNQALAGPLAEKIRTAVTEALAARDAAAQQAVPDAEPTPDPEGAPAPEGQTEPTAPTEVQAEDETQAPSPEQPGEQTAAPAAEAGGSPPNEAEPARTPPASAPIAESAPVTEAAPAVEANPAGVAASSALRARHMEIRGRDARARLLAAAGGRSKKA